MNKLHRIHAPKPVRNEEIEEIKWQTLFDTKLTDRIQRVMNF